MRVRHPEVDLSDQAVAAALFLAYVELELHDDRGYAELINYGIAKLEDDLGPIFSPALRKPRGPRPPGWRPTPASWRTIGETPRSAPGLRARRRSPWRRSRFATAALRTAGAPRASHRGPTRR